MAVDETNPSKSEPMTLDKLAQIIEKTVAKKEDLESLATKEDLKLFATKEDFRFLEDKVDALELTMKENFRLVREEIAMLNFAVEIDDLRERMKRVEQKMGIIQ